MSVRIVRTGLLAAAWGVFAACGDSGGGSESRTVIEVRSSDGDELEATIDSRGASLELAERARVSFPPGALKESVEVRISEGELAQLAPLPRGARELERPVVVEPHDLRLRRTATLELAVRDDGVPERELRVLRLADGRDPEWEQLQELHVAKPDAPARSLEDFELRRAEGEDALTRLRRVELEVDRFSIFAVVRIATADAGTDAGVDAGADADADAGEADAGPNELCARLGRGAVCRSAQGACDVPEHCDGESDACPPDDLAEAGTECRASAGACDLAERCDGDSAVCPADAFAEEGSDCDDGLFCNGADTCDADGECVSAGDPCGADADDGDDDCQESCDESGDSCTASNPDGVACQLSACSAGACQSGACVTVTPCPVFVDAAGSDETGCGSGWGADACASVQGGSDEAVRTSNGRVFVRDQTFAGAAGVPTPVLTMAEGVEYYGGFSGTENLLAERPDPLASYTTLQGNGASTQHVVVGASEARLDGFEVTGGVGGFDGSANVGAGMWNSGTVSQPVTGLAVANCRFSGNTIAAGPARGGGMYNQFVSGLTLDGVEFDGNAVQAAVGPLLGGGLANVQSSVTLSQVRFVGNSASLATTSSAGDALGGGMYEEVSDSALDGVTFEQNTARNGWEGAFGGGYAVVGANFATTLQDVQFVENTASGNVGGSGAGGGLYVDGSGYTLSLQDVSFTENTAYAPYAAEGGGAAFVGAGSELVEASTARFERNLVDTGDGVGHGGGMAADTVGIVRVNEASFVDNTIDTGPARGAGLAAVGSVGTLTLTDTQFVGNSGVGESPGSGGTAQGGGVYATVPTDVTSSDFIDNRVAAGGSFGRAQGAGVYYQGRAAGTLSMVSVAFANNAASGNSGTGQGGGAYVSATSGTFTLTNVTFMDNDVSGGTVAGAGMYVTAGAGSLDNAVFAGSSSVDALTVGGSASATIGHYCGPTDPGASDFTDIDQARAYIQEVQRAASGHPFLTADSICQGGDANAADAAFGPGAWSTLTAQVDGTPLDSTVDPGRLYEPAGPWITSFTAPDATTLQWQSVVPAGATCGLEGGGTSFGVAPSDSLTHGEESGTTFTLTCTSGGQVVRAAVDTL